jgi:tRNA(fMet)-specific endonuclease VapC
VEPAGLSAGETARTTRQALMYLLDTNTCVYIIRKRPEAVFRRLNKVADDGIALSVITAFELEVGALRAKGRAYSDAVRRFLAEFPILALEDAARRAYGELRLDLERGGKVIGPYDMLIAAHALAVEATLVTNNESEFGRVKGLRTENWVGKEPMS